MAAFDFHTYFRVLWLGTLGGDRFHWKRAFWTIAFALLLGLLAFARFICWRIDLLLFPRLRDQRIQQPVFIIGTPRSGTTLLHRLMSQHNDSVVTISLWKTLFPSIIQQKLIRFFARLDHICLKGFLRYLLAKFEHFLFRGLAGIHTTGFNHVEECVAVWLLACCSPSLYLLIPYIDQLPAARFLDRADVRWRKSIARYYREFLCRQLYLANAEDRYLGKNVFHLSRLETLMDEFPDARFIHLLRDPRESIPSTLSMFTKPWKVHSPDLVQEPRYYEQMAKLFCDYNRHFLEIRDQSPQRILTLRYEDLLRSPRETVEKACQHAGLELNPEMLADLDQQAQKQHHFSSHHHYELAEFSLTQDWLDQHSAEIRQRYFDS